mgnify:FL=1
MGLCMAGIDVHGADVAQREPFAFSEEQAAQLMTSAVSYPGVHGAVLLTTCNRTELYLSMEPDAGILPDELLLRHAASAPEKFPGNVKQGTAAAQHLMEVACGLHSQILHEEQIVTQVGQAIRRARQCRTADAVLDSLFRNAVSAGKEALTQVSVSSVPLSVSYGALKRLEQHLGALDGKTCLVIGNGSMGRQTAALLREKGCRVFMTLRTYHHGETVIPFGVTPIPYEQRFVQMESSEIVISATRSPHYTVRAKQLTQLDHRPRLILDLAMPRDIEPECSGIDGVTVWNLDQFGLDAAPDADAIAALEQIAAQYADAFQMWQNYRESVPYMQELKQLAAQRILRSTDAAPYAETADLEQIVTLAAGKTVDMLMGSMKAQIYPELLRQCCEKIKDRGRF